MWLISVSGHLENQKPKSKSYEDLTLKGNAYSSRASMPTLKILITRHVSLTVVVMVLIASTIMKCVLPNASSAQWSPSMNVTEWNETTIIMVTSL